MKKKLLLFSFAVMIAFTAGAVDTWTAKANYGGAIRHWAAAFSIGTKGYIGTGDDGSFKKDFWEYCQ